MTTRRTRLSSRENKVDRLAQNLIPRRKGSVFGTCIQGFPFWREGAKELFDHPFLLDALEIGIVDASWHLLF
jgi:hypothetical protein